MGPNIQTSEDKKRNICEVKIFRAVIINIMFYWPLRNLNICALRVASSLYLSSTLRILLACLRRWVIVWKWGKAHRGGQRAFIHVVRTVLSTSSGTAGITSVGIIHSSMTIYEQADSSIVHIFALRVGFQRHVISHRSVLVTRPLS